MKHAVKALIKARNEINDQEIYKELTKAIDLLTGVIKIDYEFVKYLLIELCKIQGCRVTKERIAILKVIYDCPKLPLTASEIFEIINKDWWVASRGTIYNSINTFMELGIINKYRDYKPFTYGVI